MDRDIKIIEAVRKEPCLYIDNSDIEERNRGWKQLSEKLKMKGKVTVVCFTCSILCSSKCMSIIHRPASKNTLAFTSSALSKRCQLQICPTNGVC